VRAHFVFAANYGLPTPASFSKSFVSEKKSALCDGKLGPSSMLVPIVSVLNRDGKFTPRLLKQFWCSFNVSCSFGLQIFHPMMDHSIPVNIQAVVRILGFCKLSVLWSWWKIHSSFASGIFVLVDLSCPFGLHISPPTWWTIPSRLIACSCYNFGLVQIFIIHGTADCVCGISIWC